MEQYINIHLHKCFAAHKMQVCTSCGMEECIVSFFLYDCFAATAYNKKHLKNVGPIRHCEPPHAYSPGVASGTVARRLRIDVHDNDNDNA